MSILSLDLVEAPPEGADESAGPIARGVTHIIYVLFATHPPTARCIDMLTNLDANCSAMPGSRRRRS